MELLIQAVTVLEAVSQPDSDSKELLFPGLHGWPVGKDWTLATAIARGQAGKAPSGGEPACVGGDFVDRSQWGALAGSGWGSPLPLHLLAAGRLGEQEVWLTIWRIFLKELNRRGDGLEQSLHRRQLRFPEKGALESERPNGAMVQSGWWWSMARAFPWENTWNWHRRPTHSRENHARFDPRPQALRSRPAVAEAADADCGQGPRQRPTADQQRNAASNWSFPTKLTMSAQALEDRADQRMASQLPPPR
jgi:hypothetical protein